MKSIFSALVFVFITLFFISCGDDPAAPTGPEGVVSMKVDTLDSPERVWVDSAAIFIDSLEYFFIDTISYEIHTFDTTYDTTYKDSPSTEIDTILITGIEIVGTEDFDTVIVSSDTLVKKSEPSSLIRVNWNPVEGANTYYLSISDSSNSANSYYWKIITDTTISKDPILGKDSQGNFIYTLRGLTPESSYEVDVFAYNSVKKIKGSSTRADRIVNLLDSPSPEAIFVSVNGNTATISWPSVPNIRKYNVVYTDILTDSVKIDSTTGTETTKQITVKENSIYRVYIKPEGYIEVDSAAQSKLIELGTSFSKIDTLYPYDKTTEVDSTTLLLPHVFFSTYSKLSANNYENMVPIKGGYFLMGDIWSITGQDSLEQVVVKSFNISSNEITNNEFANFLNSKLVSNKNALSFVKEGEYLDSTLTTSISVFDSTFIDTLVYDTSMKGKTIYDTLASKVTIHKVFDDTIIYTLKDTITFSIDIEGKNYTKTHKVYSFDLTDTLSPETDSLNIIDSVIIFSYIIPDTITTGGTLFDTVVLSKMTQVSLDIFDTIPTYTAIKDSNTIFLETDSTFLYDTADSLIKVPDSLKQNPVTGVTWEGAAAYCNWVSEFKYGYEKCYDENNGFTFNPSKRGFRMPTEAEFEYVQSAAFLGTRQKYSWGTNSSIIAADTLFNALQPISSSTSYFGIYNLTGNALEWCSDSRDYAAAKVISDVIKINPVGLSGDSHVLRGGSYLDADKAASFSSFYQLNNKPDNNSKVGFRLARWPQ